MTENIEQACNVFYDGITANAHEAKLSFTQDGLRISASSLQKTINWNYADIRTVSDLANHKGASFRVKDGLGRLDILDVDEVEQLKKLALNMKRSDITSMAWKRIGLWGAGAAASVVLIIFVLIPALANQLATMIPVDKEIALGRGSLKQIERIIGFVDDTPLICTGQKGQQALDKMAARFENHFDSPYPLTILVFDNEIPNAFALPGGYIVLFDGMIQASDSPEEVAGVLGHEMGHVRNRDATRLTLRSAGSVGILGMVFGDFAGGAVALIIAEQLIAANYSQAAEADADKFAHKLLAAAQLPSTPMAEFFDKLAKEYGDEPDLLSHLASHPDLASRVQLAKNADTIGDNPFKAILSASEWDDLRAMCKSTGG